MRPPFHRAFVSLATLLAVASLLGSTAAAGTALRYRPDAKIAERGERFRGNDIYNETGAHQRVTVERRRGQSVRFSIALQNDGRRVDRLRFGGAGGSAGVRVRYLNAEGVNVTPEVIAGIYLTPELAPGEQTAITMRVRIADTAPLGERWWLLVTGSQHVDDREDVVRAAVRIVS